MDDELKIIEVIITLDGGKLVSANLGDSEERGRDRLCCHASKSNDGKPSPHSEMSSKRLFRQKRTGFYFIPCMNHIDVYLIYHHDDLYNEDEI
jgi:hypothetical protein